MNKLEIGNAIGGIGEKPIASTQNQKKELSHGIKERMIAQTHTIEEFIANPNHITDAKPGRMCGDGRYEGNDGKISRFGADGGFVLGLLGLNQKFGLGLTPEQAVDAVVSTSEGKFYAHTDEHTHNNGNGHEHDIGCGHLAKAALPENAQTYGVNPDEVKKAIAYKKKLAKEQPDKVEIVHLQGPHLEGAVIFNMGEQKAIAHRDGDEQYFMVDVERDAKYTTELFERLLLALPQLSVKKVSLEDFRSMLNQQTETTAGILAKGLPIFKVDVDGQTPHVMPAGHIE
ncbi:MAG: hypothetical protein KA035_04170 [Candidatus Levybacteria bacterium]|nr:hypothetical protein [Candidatus Levybacteria bacterium]